MGGLQAWETEEAGEAEAGQGVLKGHFCHLRTQGYPRNAVGTALGVQSRAAVLQDSGEEVMVAQTGKVAEEEGAAGNGQGFQLQRRLMGGVRGQPR